jgi:hypothetical protein
MVLETTAFARPWLSGDDEVAAGDINATLAL